MDKPTHQIRCEQWMQVINECLASGMSKSAWCEANGISEKKFYYWQRILRNEAYLEQMQLPSVAPPKAAPPVAFVELRQTTVPAETSVFRPDVIIRNNGIVLELSNTVSPELLMQLRGLFHAE